MPQVGPALVLALIVGTFHTALYVLVRNRVERHLLFAWLSAVVGALVGHARGARLGGAPLRLGDFSVLWASALAWAGIGLIALLSLLGPRRGS